MTKKKTPLKKHPVIKRLEELVESESITDLVKITGIPNTTIGDWKRKGHVPIAVDRAMAILEKYGIKITFEEGKENE